MRDASNPFDLRDDLFKKTFRLNKDLAQYVYNQIIEDLDITDNNVAVPPLLKCFATLHFYATGSYQYSLGQNFNISFSQPVASRAIQAVTNAIEARLGPIWIKFPITLAENMICDYDLKILNVNAQYPGATHDSFIWSQSAVKQHLEAAYNEGDRNMWLIGDSGYPLQPWLITPFHNPPQNTPEFRYNAAHIRARNCIERCNGVLKSRFRCLLKERVLRYSPERVGRIVSSCAVLHNICIAANLDLDVEEVVEDEVNNEVYENNLQENIFRQGQATRGHLVNSYFRNYE
nr:unnamed protein product [Callosobruchus analis]